MQLGFRAASTDSMLQCTYARATSCEANKHRAWRMAALRERPLQVWPAPSLSYYVDCLEHNLRPGQRAVAVTEDFTNPVAPVLRTMAKLTVLNLTVIQLRHLDETVATLGCAPIVCRSHGTFWNSYVNTFHTKKLVGDGLLTTNFTEAWKNTAQQREAILYHRRR